MPRAKRRPLPMCVGLSAWEAIATTQGERSAGDKGAKNALAPPRLPSPLRTDSSAAPLLHLQLPRKAGTELALLQSTRQSV
ncbi:hypothetical protein GUJ93_ZPchr0004g40437 [Zizania palustris]|uniref:Uncharacterized protein n=1 Tax=Zizania palustris TaxID=103762 RepID=A0A8J5SMY3_ZIZPA|nr:hypothetical protein GUJ93_ZPchr0004g40437 [Zizania palustris]